MALGLPHSSGLCGSAGVTAGMASLAACSTGVGGGLRWSAQSCGPRHQSWRRMALGLPHSSGLCDSAGATAGMASLAACSTQGPAWQAPQRAEGSVKAQSLFNVLLHPQAQPRMAGAALGRLQSLLHLRLQHLTEGGPHPLLPRVRVLPHHLSDLVFAVLARWVILVSRLDLPPPPPKELVCTAVGRS